MGTEALKAYFEDRLRAIVPDIDLDPGSPAQTDFIAPVLAKLGTDPFETDIQSFLEDRFRQEFPDLYASDPGVIQEMFGDPLRVILEPFKREIAGVARNQSLQDPDLLSDDDADALVANWFQERDTGGFSVGVVRIYFANPTSVQIQNNPATTPAGLTFLPVGMPFMSAEQMAFNRSGSLFYMDVPYRAELAGDEYNVEPRSITSVEGIFGVVKVENLRKFKDGAPAQDTPTFVSQVKESLAEHSMVTRRGAFARSLKAFQGLLRAVQVVGAKDPEMQRDIIVAASPGHAWLQGQVSMYGDLAYVQVDTIDGAEDDAPTAGDEVFIYLSKTDFPSTPQASRFIRFVVESVLLGPMDESDPFQISFLVRWSGSVPDGVTLPDQGVYKGGFSKKGMVRISSIPDIGEVSLSVPNAEIHVYGHSDVYLRPVLRETTSAVLSGVSDETPLIEGNVLSTFGETPGSENRVYDSSVDFVAYGVEPGHVLIIENGDDVGVYTIRKVDTNYVYVNQKLTRTLTNLRYRIIRSITLNPFAPKVSRFPFGSALANDLQTTIGSKLFKLSSNDVLLYGAAVGDKIEVLSGSDEGTFTITGFDSTLGGQGILVDRAAAGTNSGLSYKVYKALEKVELPLVRLKQLLLLDSAEQSTGISIPPKMPVGVVPTGAFSSARVRGSSLRKTGWVLPDITGYISSANTAAGDGDRRYSLGFDTPNGYYKSVEFANGDHAELDYRTDTKGKCSWFVAPAESEDDDENFPPINPKPGECLTIKSGPNKGSYLIRQVVKFKSLNSDGKVVWYYFIQIYETFPVDVFKNLFAFLNDAGGGASVSELPISGQVDFPGFFTDLYDSLPTKLDSAITTFGGTPPSPDTLAGAVDDLVKVDYEWGDPARGVLRSYFLEPTLFVQNTADSETPTRYKFTTSAGEEIYFRPDPNRYGLQQIVPPRLTSDVSDFDLPRDLSKKDSTTAEFTDSTQPSMLNQGVEAGDVLSVHEETFFFGSSKTRQMAVQTVSGSNQVTAHGSAGTPFTSALIGSLLYIEEGADAGAYRITGVTGSSTLTLDRALTTSIETTLTIENGITANWGYDGSINKLVVGSGTPFTSGHVGKWITLYGIDYTYQGSYKVLSVPSNTTVELDRVGNFPAFPADAGLGRWILHDAPEEDPAATTSGTELVALRPIRVYESIGKDYVVSAVKYDDPTDSEITIETGLRDGYKQPYKITRENLRRVSSSEMDALRDGPLAYFDTEVVSLSPNEASNIDEDSYLVLVDGSFESFGYEHVVDDPNLTYSMQESGIIKLPTHVLPVGAEDSPANFILLAGAPVQVDYERADLVAQFQEFLSSGEDRVTVANMLARHFLPTYVSYDATYVGGSAPGVVAKDIQNYIDNIPIETAIDVSEVQNQIEKRGGNPETPTKVFVLIHDWDRRVWLERSENEVGGAETKVPYNGTPRVSYFIAGPDVSGLDPIPAGERIRLVKL